MPEFKPDTSITTTESTVEVTFDPSTPLPVGLYRFQLVVVDDSGNASDPAFVEVLVKDDQRPTAVIDAPSQVGLGQPFTLSGERSADAPPGKIQQYIWTLVTNPDRPDVPPIDRPIDIPVSPVTPTPDISQPISPTPINPIE